VQAGIVDLIKQNLLQLTEGNRFRVAKNFYTPRAKEDNPLIPALAAQDNGSLHSYEDIAANWYDRVSFSHPVLESIDRAGAGDEPFLQGMVFPVLFYGVLILRIAQGVTNGRPVGLLFAEGIGLSLVFIALWKSLSRRSVIRKEIARLYGDAIGQEGGSGNDPVVPLFATQGTSAIADLAQGALLIGIFDAYQSTGRGAGDEWSAGSSCSGSSCSGGSSCGSSCGGCSGN
jgi:hypothetical protein